MKFGIGQLVRVKYFKDLAKEHEVDSEGNITIGSCIGYICLYAKCKRKEEE